MPPAERTRPLHRDEEDGVGELGTDRDIVDQGMGLLGFCGRCVTVAGDAQSGHLRSAMERVAL